MTTIDPETLRKRLENGDDVCVVDIRSEEDYEEDQGQNASALDGGLNAWRQDQE